MAKSYVQYIYSYLKKCFFCSYVDSSIDSSVVLMSAAVPQHLPPTKIVATHTYIRRRVPVLKRHSLTCLRTVKGWRF